MSRPSVNGGQAVVDALLAHGVDTIFGIPGTHNLAIYSALRDSPIRHITPRHEQGCGYAADGYSRASGKPGVCLTTTGPAILNAAAAAAQAYSDSVPVLFIAPGMPIDHPSGHNGLLHEVRSQFDAIAAVVGHAQRATSVADIPHAVAQCFAAMTSGRPRPAYLELPIDVLDLHGTVDDVRPIIAPIAMPNPEPVGQAREFLSAAARPLIIAGGGVNGAAERLIAFAELIDAPVVTSANGKAVVPEDHPLSLGAGVHLKAIADVVRDSDLVIAVGTELAPADWWWGAIPETPLIRIDIDPLSIATNAMPTVGIVGDASATMAQLCAEPITGSRDNGAARAGHWRSVLRSEAGDIGAAYTGLCESLATDLDSDAIVAADQSMSCYYGLLGNLPLFRPRSFLYPAGLGTLGYALPAAIGAKVAYPNRQVMCVLGDGGVMFSVAELAGAAQARLPIPVVIVDNGGYGEIRNEMLDRDGRILAVDLPSPDFPKLAEAMGCHGVSAATYSDVGPAVRAAFLADRPTLIHVREPQSGS